MATPPPLASVAELGRRVGLPALGDQPESDPDRARAAAALEDASALVRAEANRGWLDETGEQLVEVPGEIHALVLQVARRAWLNPDGFTSETIDDYTWRRDSGQATGGAYLSDAEAAMCRRYRPSSGSGSGGLWTLGMTRGDGGGPDTVHVPVAGGGDPLPWLAGNDFGAGR